MEKREMLKEGKGNTIEYLEIAERMLKQTQDEMAKTKAKTDSFKLQGITLEGNLSRLKSEFDAQMRQEKQVFENEKQKTLANLRNREETAQRMENDATRRIISVSERELEVEKVSAERGDIFKKKLEYDRLTTEAQKKYDDAVALNDEGIRKIEEASTKEIESNKSLVEAKNVYSIAEKEKQGLEQLKADVQKQQKNLDDIRKDVEPRIVEYNKLIEKNIKLFKEIEEKKDEAEDLNQACNRRMQELENYDKNLKGREINVASREEDLARQDLLKKG